MLQASIHLYRNAFSGIPKPVWLLSLVMLVNRSGTMVIPFLTIYLSRKGYSLSDAGIIMATFGIGAFLGGYLGGRLTDKWGFFQVQVASLFMNGVLFVVLGYMEGTLQIGLCVFALSTLGEAFRPANAAAIGAYSNDHNRTRSYSLNRLAINLGWAIGPAVGGLLASINYALLFWVDGATCVLAALLLYLAFSGKRRTSVSQQETRDTSKAVSVYKDRSFLTGMFFIFLVAVTFLQLFSIVPLFYKEVVHLGELTIGIILASNGLLIVAVEMVLVYKLEKRGEAILYIVYGALLIGLSFLVLAIAPLLVFVLLGMLVVTFGEMLLFPFANDFWVSRTNAYNRGQYAAVYTMTFALAHVLAPLLSSRVAVWLGYSGLFIIDFAVCCVAAFGFVWLRSESKKNG